MRRPLALGLALLLCAVSVPSASAATYAFPATAVAAGHDHTCALQQLPLGLANVECWGAGGSATGWTRGDAAAVVTGPLYSVETCVLTTGFEVHCWDTGSDPEAVDTAGDAAGVAFGLQHRCILRASGDADCSGSGSLGQVAPYTGGDATAISAGVYHTCVLTSARNVACWGDDQYGQSADYTAGDAVGLAAGAFHSCALTSGGDVHCWGASHDASPSYLGGDAIAVTASESTCVLTSAGDVHCLDGWHSYTGGDAVAADLGTYHLCVLTSAGDVDCQGGNAWGQAEDYAFEPLPEPLGGLVGSL